MVGFRIVKVVEADPCVISRELFVFISIKVDSNSRIPHTAVN